MKKRILKTKRLVLRPVRLSDVDTLLPHANDPFQTRFLSALEPPVSRKKELQWIRKTRSDWNRGLGFVFGVEQKKTGELIGTTGIHDISKTHRRAMIGIFFFKQFWGRGFGTEAVRTLVDFGFSKLGLNRIEYSYVTENKRSKGIFRNMGFRLEGRKRELHFKNGKFLDTEFGSMLKREWIKRKRKKAKNDF